MDRYRVAVAAAVIVLPFSLAACSSSGALGAAGQKNAQAASAPGSGPASHNQVASSAFCQALVKASEDSAKLSSGDATDVTPQSVQKDDEDALASAPAAIKGDLQTIVDAGRAALASGATEAPSGDSQAVDTATDHIASWAATNCSFQQSQP